MATYRELQEQAAKLLEQAEQQRQAEMQDALNSIVKTMSTYDIGLEELFDHLRASGFKPTTPAKPSTRKSQAGTKVAPKYRNPATGDTWTGRGRAPAWIKEAEGKGKGRDKFLIK